MREFKIGNICKCQKGILGIITKISSKSVEDKEREGDNGPPHFAPHMKSIPYYVGIDFHGGNWESQNPIFVANDLEEHIFELEQEARASEREIESRHNHMNYYGGPY